MRPAEIGQFFRKKLEGHFGKPLRYLMLTHYHADHRTGASVFKDCTLVISQRLADIMPRNFKLKSWEATTFAENHTIQDEDLKVEIHRLGGHTAGSSIAYFPYEKAVFAGDIVFENYPWMAYVGDRTCNPEEWLAGLKFMRNLDIERIIPGHGPILNSKNELEKHIELFTKTKSLVIRAIREGKKADELDLPELEIVKELMIEKERCPSSVSARFSQRKFQKAFDKGKRTIIRKFYEFYGSIPDLQKNRSIFNHL